MFREYVGYHADWHGSKEPTSSGCYQVSTLVISLASVAFAAMLWPDVLAMADVQSRPARGAKGQAMQVDVAKVSRHEYPFDMDRAVRAGLIEALRESYDRFDAARFERGPDGKYPSIGKGKTEGTLGWLYPAMHLKTVPQDDFAGDSAGPVSVSRA